MSEKLHKTAKQDLLIKCFKNLFCESDWRGNHFPTTTIWVKWLIKLSLNLAGLLQFPPHHERFHFYVTPMKLGNNSLNCSGAGKEGAEHLYSPLRLGSSFWDFNPQEAYRNMLCETTAMICKDAVFLNLHWYIFSNSSLMEV